MRQVMKRLCLWFKNTLLWIAIGLFVGVFAKFADEQAQALLAWVFEYLALPKSFMVALLGVLCVFLILAEQKRYPTLAKLAASDVVNLSQLGSKTMNRCLGVTAGVFIVAVCDAVLLSKYASAALLGWLLTLLILLAMLLRQTLQSGRKRLATDKKDLES